MIIASNGDRVVAASIEPIPTNPKIAAGASPACPLSLNDVPMMQPSDAPRNNVGVNTPPTAPDPTVAVVATSFAANKSNRNNIGLG